MEPVVTINLNGNAYQLDQSAHDALSAYLDQAEAALASNPDKAEIMRDLEQAIADKCGGFLSAHKTVISADEMKRALSEMGPVEGAEGEAKTDGAQQGEPPKKKLYRIPEGAVIAGICSGLAAYLHVDVTVIRILMVIGGFLTGGWLLLAYVIAMFVIPTAHTSEEWAAAHGIPFNAQEVIDQAKRQYQDFSQYGPPWRWQRGTRRAWKRAMRERARAWAYAWDRPPPPRGPVSYAGSVLGGILTMVLTLIRIVLFIVFIAFFISLVTTGTLGYWTLPPNMHVWQAILVLIAVYAIISIPLRAMRYAAYGLSGWRPYYGYYHGGESFFALLAIVLAGWFAYQNIPEAHVWMDQARDVIQQTFQEITHADSH